MLHILEHTLLHTIEDSVKLLPFLFFTYLLMELLEHTTGGKVQNKIKKCRESRTAVGWTSWNYAAMWFLGSSVQPLCRTSHYGWNAACGIFIYVGRDASDFYFRGGRTGNNRKNSRSKSLHCDYFRISCRTGLCECF